jgi:hypothetical protein
MKTKDLIAEVMSLPLEQRVLVIDSLLKSLNPRNLKLIKSGL